ncbi:sensor domain-containing diguanylate cyclase [Kineosporia sp. NBRC 101731]|uniref:GGDEF domain-containing protein n=1 Tax=Kineosporia sp. NBRC 101731 TaxID=3032199 RepID=UPI00249FFE85|nr:sensor domain-containing diguanylate cyclase [Kineosporia sp. NBRC 101731]GLY31101.1 hypothetical protein Kisp02_44660 [Kineosporia sp. NBRC 101731]
MDWARSGLGARNPRAAAQTASWILLLCAAAIPVTGFAMPRTTGQWTLLIGTPVIFVVLAGVLMIRSLPTAVQGILLIVAPLLGVAGVVTLNIATHDPSAGAQVMLCLPALFAATHLKTLGALIVAVFCMFGVALNVAMLRPNGGGLYDWFDVSLVIGLMTGVMLLGGRRHDRLIAMLEAQASRDPLTGLVTRRILDEAMHRALMPPVPRQGGDARGTALVLLDLDHFKAINDTYGHPVGDDALVHLATLLHHDTGTDVVIARLGGDEMAVLLPRCTAPTAQEWARALLARVLSHPLPMPTGADLPLGISVGVGHSPGPMPLRDLYAAADASLYAAKHAGRGQVGPTRTASPIAPREAATPTPPLVRNPPTVRDPPTP